MNWVVVLFGASQCDGAGAPEGMLCPIDLIGPFPTRDEADAVGASHEAFLPHYLPLRPPEPGEAVAEAKAMLTDFANLLETTPYVQNQDEVVDAIRLLVARS